MDQLNIMVVEDNSLIAFELKSNIEEMGHKVVRTSATALGAIKQLDEHEKIDLVLLDINLKGDKDGVSVARELEKKGIPFIFLTSYYDNITLERVKDTNFAAFIPKPYTDLDLRLNIELAHRKNSMKTVERKKTFYIYNDNKMNKKIMYDDILYIKSDDNYSVFHTEDKKILVRVPMKNLPEELGDDRFFRIHRSYMVNTDKIQSFSNNAVIINSETLPISNSYRKDFKTHLDEYWA